MRLIDADELLEHVGRDRLDSRELIMKMINDARTIDLAGIQLKKYRDILRDKKENFRPTEMDSDWWYNRKTGIIDGLEIAYETFVDLIGSK